MQEALQEELRYLQKQEEESLKSLTRSNAEKDRSMQLMEAFRSAWQNKTSPAYDMVCNRI